MTYNIQSHDLWWFAIVTLVNGLCKAQKKPIKFMLCAFETHIILNILNDPLTRFNIAENNHHVIERLPFNNEYLSKNDSNNKRISRFITLNISG